MFNVYVQDKFDKQKEKERMEQTMLKIQEKKHKGKLLIFITVSK